eukprot:scaffold698_cov127-Isochrysis_galbana.AAC.1
MCPPSGFSRASKHRGLRGERAAEPDWTRLSAVAQAALGRTQRKLSDAADAWAAASGKARTLPPVNVKAWNYIAR